jgi:translation initiation factor 6
LHSQRLTVEGENFIGLLGFATDKYAIISPKFPYESILDVPTLKTQAHSTNLVGMFLQGNSSGLIAPYFLSDNEFQNLQDFLKPLDVRVSRLEGKYTALGNMLAVNDKKALISENLLMEKGRLEDALGVEAIPGDIGGRQEVGAHLIATNKGFLANPTSQADLERLSQVFGVNGLAGTVNRGVPYVKSGLIANSMGYLAGGATTPIEMQQIEDALNLY